MFEWLIDLLWENREISVMIIGGGIALYLHELQKNTHKSHL